MIKQAFHMTYKAARSTVIAVVGVTVLIIGMVMIVTPGPAVVFIPVGLAILSIEFAWARVWLKHLRRAISNHNSKNLGDQAENHRNRVSGD